MNPSRQTLYARRFDETTPLEAGLLLHNEARQGIFHHSSARGNAVERRFYDACVVLPDVEESEPGEGALPLLRPIFRPL
jgi:hypothetical protein